MFAWFRLVRSNSNKPHHFKLLVHFWGFVILWRAIYHFWCIKIQNQNLWFTIKDQKIIRNVHCNEERENAIGIVLFLLATLYPLTLVRPHQTFASLFLSLLSILYGETKIWMSQFSIVVEILSANRDISLCKMFYRCLWALDIALTSHAYI